MRPGSLTAAIHRVPKSRPRIQVIKESLGSNIRRSLLRPGEMSMYPIIDAARGFAGVFDESRSPPRHVFAVSLHFFQLDSKVA